MGERVTVDPEVVQAAELKRRAVEINNSRLQLAIDEIGPHFPATYSGDGRSAQYGSFWVNPEETSNHDTPAIVITRKGIKKTIDRFKNGPDLRDLKQLSHADHTKYFETGMGLLRQFAEIEKLRRKAELTPNELKNLVHLIWSSGGGSDEYEGDGIMEIAGDKPIQVTASEPPYNFIAIEFYNGLPDNAGEEVKLFEDKERDELSWKIGAYKAFYSELLSKPFEIEEVPGDPVYSKENLSGKELAVVGWRLADNYIRARSIGVLPEYS